jgi:hypothetical protein
MQICPALIKAVVEAACSSSKALQYSLGESALFAVYSPYLTTDASGVMVCDCS